MSEVEYKTAGSVLRSVADKWKEQYCKQFGGWSKHHADKAREETYHQLVRCLANGGTAEEVTAIIGNDSWSTLTCDICREKVTGLACFGEPYESYSEVCLSCLSVMHRLLLRAEMDDLKGVET